MSNTEQSDSVRGWHGELVWHRLTDSQSAFLRAVAGGERRDEGRLQQSLVTTRP